MKVTRSTSFRTVDVVADGSGLSSRAGTALLALTASAWGSRTAFPVLWQGRGSVARLMIRDGFCVTSR